MLQVVENVLIHEKNIAVSHGVVIISKFYLEQKMLIMGIKLGLLQFKQVIKMWSKMNTS